MVVIFQFLQECANENITKENILFEKCDVQ